MTANQGPGVPVELRERLITVMQFVALPLEVINDDRACAAIEVDAILQEIAASGFEIVASDRLERVERVAINGRAYCRGRVRYGDLVSAVNTLQPGDLDGVGTGGDGRS